MPTCATMMQQRPSTTLCPICTRLSSREPAPITVSPAEPRSTVLLAPISTSSCSSTRPSCGTVRNPRTGDRKAEAFLSDPRAGIDIDPVAENRMTDAGMRADPAVAAEHDAAADHRGRTDAAAGADFGTGLDDTKRTDIGRRIDHRSLVDDRRRMNAGRCHRRRVEQLRDPRPARIGLARHDRHRSCPARAIACPDARSRHPRG